MRLIVAFGYSGWKWHFYSSSALETARSGTFFHFLFKSNKLEIVFETERLTIRKMHAGDIDAIHAMRSDADVMRYIREPQSRAEAANWITLVSSKWDKHGIGFCSLVERASTELVGWCGLWRLSETNEIEVGYAIAKRFWRRGFAHEAAARLLRYGFEDLDLDQIVAVAREENDGSRAVMTKLGMKFDYIGRFYEAELVHYSILRREYDALRNRQTDSQKI